MKFGRFLAFFGVSLSSLMVSLSVFGACGDGNWNNCEFCKPKCAREEWLYAHKACPRSR